MLQDHRHDHASCTDRRLLPAASGRRHEWPEGAASALICHPLYGNRLLHPCHRRILDACRCLCTHEPAHILPRHVGSDGDRLHHLLFCRYASCQYEKYPDEAGGQERYRFFRPSAGRDHQYGRDGSLHGRLFPFHRECLRYPADL